MWSSFGNWKDIVHYLEAGDDSSHLLWNPYHQPFSFPIEDGLLGIGNTFMQTFLTIDMRYSI